MKILVIQLGRIGDMILATPMFSAIKTKFPLCELHVLTSRHNHSILKDNPNVDSIRVYEKSPDKFIKSIYKINRQHYDYLIDPKDHFSMESNIIAFWSGAKFKIGLNQNNHNNYNVSISHQEESKGLHYTQRCLKSLAYFGIVVPQIPPRPELFLNTETEKNINEILIGKSHYILINISASSPNKMWQNEKWKEFINKISYTNEKLYIINPASHENEIDEILKKCTNVISIKSGNIMAAFSIISRAKLLITPDTSLVHVAAAFNIPVLSLYSGMENFYEKFYPLSDIYKVVKAPDVENGIKNISVEELFSAYGKIIEQL